MMRKILPALGLVCVGAAAQAQGYINNSQNTMQDPGYFNIANFGKASQFRTAQTTGNGGNGHFIMMSLAGVQRWGIGTRLAETGSDLGSDYSIFAYQDDGNFMGEHMTIKRKTGFMGIGENSPEAKLHIGSLANVGASLMIGKAHDPANKNVELGGVAGGYNIDFKTWRDSYPDQTGARIRAERINTHTAWDALIQAMDMSFYTSDALQPQNLSERMRIKYDGKIGINEAKPNARLHIGATAQEQMSLMIGKAWDAGNTNVPMGAVAGAYNIDFRGYRDVHPDQVGARIRAERINNHAAGAAYVQAMDIAFLTSTGMDPESLSEKMRIRFDGNVGIGVTDPKHKLTVEGTVAARKVKVTAQTTWADFVFNDDYRLPSLGELEAFIKQYRHLPEIPAEAEVLKEGIDIGDMNKKLLQKVEELTLYLIDEHKKNEQQQQQIKALEETVAKLQSANK